MQVLNNKSIQKGNSKPSTRTRKRTNKNITPELLLRLTLEMIDEHHSSKGVNLREIAKRAGCAHTNIYNYFKNLEELIWYALAHSYKFLAQYIMKKIGTEYNASQFFAKLIESQIDFALEHPGLYRFMWLEPAPGTPPKSVMKYWNKFIDDFVLMIFALSDKKLNHEKCEIIAEIIMGYIHGEISDMIQLPKKKNTKEKERITKNAQILLEALINYYRKNQLS